MSEAISVLNGATFDGFVSIKEAGLRGMISVRGDFAAASFTKAVSALTGADFPAVNEAKFAGDYAILWMSPDELLILCAYENAQADADKLAADLAGEHALVANVSDARALFAMSGELLREALMKLTPANVSEDAFKPGQVRRTRLAQAAAAVWMLEDGSVEIMCFRSVGDYMFKLLCNAANPGAELGL
ncbi:sarcosine oxidase subunit gamma [Candidatus Halocynthiibacter alkanivorans]|uniref:sarcosine oxidase subunit gamma n=1 Tax=Candidatus Halocynthiibacter alkanivorans TaxID=2267619 RepID=UPI000DF25095|nr:sarcosine oxidase subunit gamma family protein [Candidatus Halocynthiibacter alkanivorans]